MTEVRYNLSLLGRPKVTVARIGMYRRLKGVDLEKAKRVLDEGLTSIHGTIESESWYDAMYDLAAAVSHLERGGERFRLSISVASEAAEEGG
jgi:hypothetical protein